MKGNGVTVAILREIRDEIRALRADTNARFDETNAHIERTNERIDGTNVRIEGTNDRLENLERRVVSTEVRLGTEILAMRGDLTTAIDLLRGHLDLRPRVERCEQDIAFLKEQAHRPG